MARTNNRATTAAFLARWFFLVAVGIVVSTTSAFAQRQSESTEDEDRSFSLNAGLTYLYGDWDQGDLDLDPRLGMIGLRLEAWFAKGKLAVTGSYVSGDFQGEEAVQLGDPVVTGETDTFDSRKQLSLDESREDIEVSLLIRPFRVLTLEVGYKYLDYDFNAMVDLVSDIRTYGMGTESYKAEGRGLLLGARFDVPFHPSWTASVIGAGFPELDTQVQGSYRYDLSLEGRTLMEDWTANGTASGYRIEGLIEYRIGGEPVSLRLGYVMQQIEAKDTADATWVDDDLGQGSRDWLNDTFRGGTFGVMFRF